MITQIDIFNFGLFKNYSWNTFIGKQETFRRVNIIYGRNYSGKTTLSRILKSIENENLHKNYPDGGFSIKLSNGKVITQHNFENDYKIRVYNSDFVKENLSWLHNDDGTIKPFTILGAKNIELEKKVQDIVSTLGNLENKIGLFYEIDEKEKESNKLKQEYDARNDALEDKLRKRANDKIKVDSNLFAPSPAKKTYTINDIKSDIASIEPNLSRYILSSEQTDERKKLMKEVPMANIGLLQEAKPNFLTYYEQSNKLLEKKITPSQPLVDLVNDSLLQTWVRQGIDRHKNKRTTCGFCGNPIGNDLWDKLDAHFNQESEELRQNLKSQIDILEKAKKNITEFLKINKESFYASLSTKFDELLKSWNLSIKLYSANIDKLITELTERERDIFKEIKLNEIEDNSPSILEIIKNFNKLVSDHNNKASTLSADQLRARQELRQSDIAQFLTDINYQKEIKKIQELKHAYQKSENDITPIKTEINARLEEKRALEAQTKDESKGAELVNRHLSHFFGHNELKLISEGEASNIKFKITREGVDANNLSEGECSLISFCYFIAKIEDELKNEADINKLIIYIDDPISSLDSNHIFFMFSLIESIIVQPKRFGQLFISTHNLDFLKYLKRLTIPRYKPQTDSKDKADVKHFIIDRKNKGNTQLKIAPDYLKNYITEFNYLFNQIYQCSISDTTILTHEYQYNFGNNMRKFLEAYLFYKYPNYKLSNEDKLKIFFENDTVTITLINRVINEYSHLGEHLDRGMTPIDLDEIIKISTIVISRIKEIDPHQFDALVESIQ